MLPIFGCGLGVKDDVFSRPPVPGLNGLPRERKHRYPGPTSPDTRIKLEPPSSYAAAVATPPSLIPPVCIKMENPPPTPFRRFESYPPPQQPLTSSSIPQLQIHHNNNVRRYSLPEYRLPYPGGPPQEHDQAPLNLTRRCSSSDLSRLDYQHIHPHEVKREIIDDDYGHQPRDDHSSVEAVYREYKGGSGAAADYGHPPATTPTNNNVQQVYRGEFESGHPPASAPSADTEQDEKEPSKERHPSV